MNTDEYGLRIGLDWANDKHDLMVLAQGQDEAVHHTIDSAPESIHDWLAHQRGKQPAARFAVCLEQSRGAICYALMKYDFVDLFPANPSTLAKYRQAFRPSRAKDDRGDAGLLLELLVKHPERVRRLKPDATAARKLTLLCEARRKEVDERTRLANRLQSLLKETFPQALALCGKKLYAPMALDFLARWETFQALRRARPASIRRFYKDHHGSQRLAQACLTAMADSRPLTDDPAIMDPAALRLRSLIGHIRQANHSVRRFDQAIKQTYPQVDRDGIFSSFPGAGKALAPRLSCAFGADRSRWTSAREFQTASGVAPVTETSGKSHWVHWRWSCPTFLRQSLVEYAQESRKRSAWARAFYENHRAKGKGHHTTLRALAFKWARVMFRCWHERQPYDEERYTQALKSHGSWLANAA